MGHSICQSNFVGGLTSYVSCVIFHPRRLKIYCRTLYWYHLGLHKWSAHEHMILCFLLSSWAKEIIMVPRGQLFALALSSRSNLDPARDNLYQPAYFLTCGHSGYTLTVVLPPYQVSHIACVWCGSRRLQLGRCANTHFFLFVSRSLAVVHTWQSWETCGYEM